MSVKAFLDQPYTKSGRYHFTHPKTGKKVSAQRATTDARTVANTWGITGWQKRNVAMGMGRSPDLVARAASTTDRDVLNEVVDAAEERAAASAAANFGSAMHEFTVMAEAGQELVGLPPEAKGDIEAYLALLEAEGITTLATELVVYFEARGIAGKLDRIISRGGAYIADIKTGADLSYSWGEIAIQLADYALAEWLFDPAVGWVEKPDVDQQKAYVFHMPYGQGTCDLWEVDISAAVEFLPHVDAVKKWRNRRDLAALALPGGGGRDDRQQVADEPADAVPTDSAPVDSRGGGRVEWVRGRVLAFADDERGRRLLAQGWPDGTPPKPPWTDEQVDALAALCDRVEDTTEAPWNPPDPKATEEAQAPPSEPEGPPERFPAWDVLDDGVKAVTEDVTALRGAVARLPETGRQLVFGWVGDATRAERPIDGKAMTQRQWLCARAAIAIAKHLGTEADAVRGLTTLIGRWETTWQVGPTIGCLTAEQAERLAVWAETEAQA